MKVIKANIADVKINPNNPRLIKDDKFTKLVQSIKDFPEMLEIRPIVVNSDMVVLGGNMRLKACKEAGIKEIPIIIADNLTEDQQREFLIKDNVSGGEWDWDMLSNEWDSEELTDWGLDLPIDLEDIKQTKDIPDIGQIEFSEELLLEHNYIVLYFDNPMDWEVAQEVYGLKDVKSKDSSDKTKKIGIGRVINGKNFI
jgi:ParB-like chromosome segregation protein Spo0J